MTDRIASGIRAASRKLCRDLAPLRFSQPVSHVYNPLAYARRPYELYVERYGATAKRVLYLGMNPGPFGMAQTGVPFGDVSFARDWLGLEARVGRPEREHPRRPIRGFDCPRSEVSGTRLWGGIRDHYRTPGRFFRRAFIANYCPLVFLEQSGRNRTPDKLRASEREALYQVCDRHLRRVVELLEPRFVVGIGAFAETRAREALAGERVEIGRILHPSPANPRAQRNWADQARQQLEQLGVCRRRADAGSS